MKERERISCLLCQGLVSIFDDDEDRFLTHMKTQHDAYFNLDFLRAACYMNQEEKDAVIDVIKNKKINNDFEDNVNESVELEETVKLDEVTKDKDSEDCFKTPVKDLANESPVVSKKRLKIFICNVCNKEFPTKFLDLANHKVTAHKMSKKESQVISMKHVRYDEILDDALPTVTSNKRKSLESAGFVSSRFDSMEPQKWAMAWCL